MGCLGSVQVQKEAKIKDTDLLVTCVALQPVLKACADVGCGVHQGVLRGASCRAGKGVKIVQKDIYIQGYIQESGHEGKM